MTELFSKIWDKIKDIAEAPQRRFEFEKWVTWHSMGPTDVWPPARSTYLIISANGGTTRMICGPFFGKEGIEKGKRDRLGMNPQSELISEKTF